MPLLNSLHWLPVQSRIIFKLCTIAYQTLSDGEAPYLFSMLSVSLKSRVLRLSGSHLSDLTDKTHAGTLAFSVTVPTHWNALPERVNS